MVAPIETKSPRQEPLFLIGVGEFLGDSPMQEAIDRVMRTYGLIAKMSPEAEDRLRCAVTSYLATSTETDTNKLAVEGLKFARETAGQYAH